MIENKILITNIQHFSLHDGPGIRTTIFLKGCGIKCPWCANPENYYSYEQKYIKDGVVGIYGKTYTCDELYTEVIKDKPFYIGEINNYRISRVSDLELLPGGVTFSGGEPLLQMERLLPLFDKLSEDKVHTTIETSLFAPWSSLEIAINHIDLFYVDMKILDAEKCSNILAGSIQVYLDNLHRLLNSQKPIIIRIPIINGYTDDCSNINLIVDKINECLTVSGVNILKIELMKEHSLGISKYQSLINAGNDIKMPDYKGVSDELLQEYKIKIERGVGLPVEIYKI